VSEVVTHQSDREQRRRGPRPHLAATLGPLLASGLDAREALERIGALGYPAVQWSATTPGIRPRELDRSARRGVAERCRHLELSIAGVDAWIPAGDYLDRKRVDFAVHAVEEAIRFAAECASAGEERPVVAVAFPAEATAAIDAIAEIASRFGVVVADHARPPKQRPGIGLGIDPVAVLADGGDPAAAVAAAGVDLASARLADLLRSGLRGPVLEPGEARLDVLSYRVALELAGVRRPLVADARQWRDPLGGLAATLDRWRAETGALEPA
jgi:hypothetical protein